ncbi:MAG: AAA family ATPase [Myxococcota bacterium]
MPERDEALLPVIALFGANAAGKSNVVNAVSWLWSHLMRSHESTARSRHVFFEKTRPTKLVVRFLAGGSVYEYGVNVLDQAIAEEWLVVVLPSGQERIVFERRTAPGGQVSIEYGRALEKPSEKLEALKVLGAPAAELFLARLWRDLADDELPECLREPHLWMKRLVIVQAGAPYVVLGTRLQEEPAFGEFVSTLLRKLGTGVERVSSELKLRLPARELSPAELEAFERYPIGGAFGRRGREVLVKLSDDEFGLQAVVTTHLNAAGEVASLPFEAESDGTKRIAELAPALHETGSNPCVFVVDELDRSLHAVLVKEFIREFLRRARGHRNQLIFTTHETHALDQELLRRDEIWFVEKRGSASELFSLDDFPVRTDLRLDRSYLLGRFGAIPNVHLP